MAEPQTPKAPFSSARHQGGKTASMPNSTSHSSGGAPRQVKAGVNKGRTNSYEKPLPSKSRRGSQA